MEIFPVTLRATFSSIKSMSNRFTPGGKLTPEAVAQALSTSGNEARVVKDTGGFARIQIGDLLLTERETNVLCANANGTDAKVMFDQVIAEGANNRASWESPIGKYLSGNNHVKPIVGTRGGMTQIEEYLTGGAPQTYTPPPSTDSHWSLQDGLIA